MSGDRDYDAGVCDATELVRLLVEAELLEGGDLGVLRRRVETLWLEFSHARSEIINDRRTGMATTTRNGRAVKALRTAEEGHQYATAGAEQARREVAKWEAAIVEAGERVDGARADVLREHAAALRQRAEQRRGQAEQAGDATEDVPITSFSPAMGSRTTLTRSRVADRLAAEAATIDARADQLVAEADGYERAVREFAELEREEPLDEARVARRRAGIEGLRASLADQIQRILEEGD